LAWEPSVHDSRFDVTDSDVKVVVNWGIRQMDAHFEVPGKDAKAALANLLAREEWGSFEGFVTEPRDKAIDMNAQGIAVKVVLAPWYRIQLPRWRGYTTQRAAVQESWDAMWKALQDHERGHLEIFMRGFNAIVKSLEDATELEGGEVKRQLEKAAEGIQQEHDQYDTKTEHGKTTGVDWKIP
jgi:Bacterial protein of unknown function (DUF922)